MSTTNLLVTEVQEAQSSKEVTINDGFAAFDRLPGVLTVTDTGGTVVLDTEESQHGTIRATGNLASPLIIELLEGMNGGGRWVINDTDGAETLNVRFGAGGTPVEVAPGAMTFVGDGFSGQGGGGASTMQRVVTVAKSGGEFDSIQDAIDSISDAASNKRYIVLVYPGLYTEQVTMKDWVDVRGTSKRTVQLTHTGDNNGTVILSDWCQIEDLLIELSTVSTEWGIVGSDVGNWHIRNVDLLAASGSNISGGVKATGNTWSTGFIEHCIINYRGTTGHAILIQGNSGGPQAVDCHLNDVFVDALDATTGGCFEVKDCNDVYLTRSLLRVAPAASGAFGLKTSRTSTGTVYARVENCSLEGTSDNALVVGANTTVYWSVSSAESKTLTGTIVSTDYVVQTDLSVEVSATADQAIPTATWTKLALDEEKFDTGGFHDNVTNNTRLTVPIAGRYLFHGSNQFIANATGLRLMRVLKNNTTVIAECGGWPGDGSVGTRCNVVGMEALAEGDYIELQVWQNSGGDLDSQFPDDFAPRFGMTLLQ